MTAVADILGKLPLDQLAGQLGASKEDTATAATQAITSLLGGMAHNAKDPQGEVALAKALTTHAAKKSVAVEDVDPQDGEKIVKHVLGTTPARAAKAVSAKTGTDSNLITQLLPILAPIVLNYLGNRASQSSGAGGGNLLASVLGGVLGGGSQAPAASDGLGGLLGGVLGGGSAQAPASSGGLASMLGGVLGGVLGSQAPAATTRTASTAKRTTSTSTAKRTTSTSAAKKTTSTAKKTTSTTRKKAEPEPEADGGILSSIINSIF